MNLHPPIEQLVRREGEEFLLDASQKGLHVLARNEEALVIAAARTGGALPLPAASCSRCLWPEPSIAVRSAGSTMVAVMGIAGLAVAAESFARHCALADARWDQRRMTRFVRRLCSGW